MFAGAAHASVTISSDTTQNMSCANGVCAPTATDAVLNVGDLENLLAAASVEVTTTGSGVQADNIVVDAPFAWSTASALSLDAERSIEIEQPVSVQALSALALTTNGGSTRGRGTLSFGTKGNVAFANLSSSLTINGAAYTLVNTVKALGAAVSNNPSGDYAFASSYDAKQDGTYDSSPIIEIEGIVDGLGNVISNLSISDLTTTGAAPFGTVSASGTLADIRLERVVVRTREDAAGLVGTNQGTIESCSVTGKVRGGRLGTIGGLVSDNFGSIGLASSSASVSQGKTAGDSALGGLVGLNDGGSVSNSFATGPVSGGNGIGYFGGLAGENYDASSAISNSYASGSVSAGYASGPGAIEVGGLIAGNAGKVGSSYSTGSATAGNNNDSYVGGFIGANGDSVTNGYWDTTTSGTDTGVGYGDSTGVTGLTTEQLQSGLPTGFDPKVWAEKPKLNGGLPYLVANPPP